MNGPPPGARPPLPTSVLDQVDRICDRFEADWASGARPRIEDHLGEVPPAFRPDLLSDLLSAELAARRRRGERPEPREYADRFPDELDAILAAFADSPVPIGGEVSTADDVDGHAEGDGAPAVVDGPVDDGRFRVVRPHARGGLGAVFVAVDRELRREVALKRMRRRHARDPQSRSRFLREAEITGGLEHPGIVPVYGLGASDDGRPYYAMRFIEGDSLREAIDRFHADEALKQNPGQRSLELRKLLRRFVDVCNAIDYAHSRGVLHRDIKPGNIIVGRHGETLVVDWGLAKPIDSGGDGTAAGARPIRPLMTGDDRTLPGSVLGTPSYMSPEQASGEVDGLGPRSDVYSLGATLYVLLAGRPPFDRGEIEGVLAAVQRGDFRPPRRGDPAIDRSLEAVCLKAMALRPESRYESARALGDDIERWMADEPVAAWREPFPRRARRWARRNRTTMTAGAAALVMALAGLAGMLIVQSRASRRLGGKNAELLVANRREAARFDLAMDAIKHFHDEVSQDLLLKEARFDKLRGRLLQGAVDFYGQLETSLQGQTDPGSRAALASAYQELANLTARIGSQADAIRIHRKALAVRREWADRPDAGPEARLQVARSLITLGGHEFENGDAAVARRMFDEARTLVEGLEASGYRSDATRLMLARALYYMSLHELEGPKSETLELARRALQIAREVADAHPDVEAHQDLLGETHSAVGSALAGLSRAAEALEHHERALAIRRGLAAAHPANSGYLHNTGRSYRDLGWTYLALGRPDEALAAQERAQAIWQELLDKNPADTSYPYLLALGSFEAALSLDNLGELERAIEVRRRGQAIATRLFEADPGHLQSSTLIIYGIYLEGRNCYLLGRSAEEVTAYERALEWIRKTAQIGGYSPLTRRLEAACLTGLVVPLLRLGRHAEARSAGDRSVALLEALIRDHPSDGWYRNAMGETRFRLGQSTMAAGDPAGAAAAFRRSLGMFAEDPDPAAWSVIEAECRVSLSALAGVPGSGVTAVEGRLEADRSIALLREAVEQYGFRTLALLKVPSGFDAIRRRPEFQLLLMDLELPTEPFAR